MARLGFKLLLLRIYCLFLTGSKVTTTLVNGHLGPTICRELCQRVDDSFSFMEEYLCRRIPRDGSDDVENRPVLRLDSFTCLVKENAQNGRLVWKNARGQEVCFQDFKENEEAGLSKIPNNVRLFKASREGNLCLVKYILKHDLASIDSRGLHGYTPVMAAAVKAQLAVFDFLISRGCDMLATADHNQNLLHLACAGGCTKIVKTIIDKTTIDLDSRGWYKWTPLMYAAKKCHRAVVDLLITKGSDLTAVATGKLTTLHVACMCGDIHIVQHIVEKNKVGIESRDFRGETPLMYAAKHGHQNVFDFLCRKGSDVKTVTYENQTILHMSCTEGHVNMVKHILSKNIVNIDSRNTFGETPAMLAAMYGPVKMLELLVSKGCNHKTVDSCMNNILHFACVGAKEHTIKYILSKHFFTIESRGYHGRTPVLLAAEKGNVEIVSLLVKRKCNLKATDNEGNNALHLASFSGNHHLVKYLLFAGVDVLQRNNGGATPLDVARDNNKTAVVDFLKSRQQV